MSTFTKNIFSLAAIMLKLLFYTQCAQHPSHDTTFDSFSIKSFMLTILSLCSNIMIVTFLMDTLVREYYCDRNTVHMKTDPKHACENVLYSETCF